MSRYDIVAIGEPMVEFNQRDAREPLYLQGFGGDTSNMIIAATRSGARTAYFTRIGADGFGAMLRALWAREAVDDRYVIVDAQSFTAAYFVSHDAGGHRFDYLRSGSAASRMTPTDLPAQLIDGARFVHASGISLAISTSAADTVFEAYARARAAGARISFDLNWRPRLWPAARARGLLREAIATADFCFASAEEIAALTGVQQRDAMLDWLHAAGAKTAFLKLGADGVIASDGRERRHLRGYRVCAVDATGAGDCFCGAVLARLAAGDPVFEAAAYGNAAAALATTGFGAVAPLPRPQQVQALRQRCG